MAIKDNMKKGSIEMLLLDLLNKEEELYGYQMVQMIEQRSKGALKVPEGSMYPTLYKLLEKGYIGSEKRKVGKRMERIYYKILPEGVSYLELLKQEYYEVNKAIQNILNYEREEDCND